MMVASGCHSGQSLRVGMLTAVMTKRAAATAEVGRSTIAHSVGYDPIAPDSLIRWIVDKCSVQCKIRTGHHIHQSLR